MVSGLPVPIEFRLPEGWEPASPDAVGASRTAFVAVYPDPEAGFTPNITIDALTDIGDASLTTLADGSIEVLRGSGAEVSLASRSKFGSTTAPGLTQTLTVHATLGGEPRQLVQAQAYLGLTAPDQPTARAVLRLVLTATVGQFPMVLPDFQYFVWTVRPDTDAS